MTTRTPVPTATGELAARGSLRLLVDPTFGPYFLGKMLSTAGVWIHNIAAAIVVYDLTRSATLVGAVSIAQFAPQLVLTPICGAMADRGDRKRQLIAGRLVAAAGSFGLTAWILVIGLEGTPGAMAVIGAALVVGIGFALGGPAMQALIPSLVRPSELATAVALSSAPFTVARATGPAVGALVVSGAGPATAFAVAGVGNLLFAGLIWVIRIREVARSTPEDSSVRAGLRHIRADRVVLAMLVGTAALGVGVDPAITLTPPIADALGGGSRLVGALASLFGVGAAVSFLLLGTLRRSLGLPRMAPVGLGLIATGLGLLALAPVPWVAMAAMVVGGTGMTLAVTSLSTQVQQRVPEELRGRVMSVWMIAFLGSRPLAAGMNGALTDAFSAPVALGVVVAVLVAGVWVVRPARLEAVAPERLAPDPA